MNRSRGEVTTEYRWARRIVFLTGGFVLAGWIMMIGFEQIEDIWLVLIINAGILLYAVLALLIIRRHPRHTVGWLFLLIGLDGSLMTLNGLGLFAWAEKLDSTLMQGIVSWFDLQLQTPWMMIPITLVLLFFPGGKLPSSRWKPVLVLAFIAILYTQATPAFSAWRDENRGPFDADNPLEIPGSELIFEGSIGAFFELLSFIAILACLASVIVRFVRSEGVERMQMKWLVYSAAVIIFLIFAQLLLGLPEMYPELMWYFIMIAPALLALAIGLAILRFRLFDIDIIIRRTLSYAVLTAFLALIYFGGVVLIQSIFRGLAGNPDSPLITVISTLTIAALFNPMRIRIQDFIDRRFYRSKYDAEQALNRFSNTARDEVDMDRLTVALLNVVEDTIQPENTSLWIRR